MMHRVAFYQSLMLAFLFLPLLAAGCSSGPGRGVSLFAEGHKLTDSAKEMREANARPLQVPRELEKQPLPSYVVEPGDVLLVQPSDIDSPVRFPGDQPVLPDGTINLGKYGHVLVMGKTVPEIELLVRSTVQTQTKDAGFISVRLVSRQSKVYYVIGEVNSPGTFQLTGSVTVLDALMQAGGLTDGASRDNIILTRPTPPNCPRIVLPVCWKQIVQLGDTTSNYQIAPGDRIYVPSRTFWESVPGFKKHAKTPCCSNNEPHALPPNPGNHCILPPDLFHGLHSVPPITPAPFMPTPTPVLPAPMPVNEE